MIGDIFVGALLLLSGFINVLAIGAFWITPSLRTTANRFVINLLLVNFISCLILSPFAFNVNANSPTSFITSSSSNINNSSNSQLATDVVSKVDNNTTNGNNDTTVDECSNQTLECLYHMKQSGASNESYSYKLIETIENISMRKYQTWSLDLVVALSVLSVLLVILDTFIAVTDPLRYHSRISDLKAWLLIALCWILSIIFGIASALRTASDVGFILSDDTLESVVNDKKYNMMFLLTYFLLIIIMPFLLVILMYWRIYSEARESGQRMRQNGSSPLLQSALNLAATANAHPQQSTILTNPQCMLLSTSSPHHHHHHHQHHHQQTNNKQLVMNKQDSSCANYFINNNNNNNSNSNNYVPTNLISDGLTMKIDKQNYSVVNVEHQRDHPTTLNLNGISNGGYSSEHHTKTFLLSSPPHECMPMLSTFDEETSIGPKSQQHQNILLTLTTVCEQTMKRNHSVKHLHLLTESDFNGRHDESKVVELRQVHSTPNLHHVTSPELMTCNQDQTLELPSIQASPKALRYMTSLRHRLSNASSLFKYREEGRAARISILVVIMFLLTYLPYGILLLVHGQESIIKESNITLLSIIFVLLANLCSPIIFAYRNKRVRRGVRRLLGIDKKTNERLEKLNSLKRSCSTRIKNYRQNNLHKSLNLGNGIKASNIRRTKSFQTCNYLTPFDAAKMSMNNTISKNSSNISFSNNNESPMNIQKSLSNVKEKKSILKIVADSSRKFRCQFTNCQNGINQDQTMPVEV
ncbi:unnamed protein product [Chironomus riparius]|uniref:G-protein coupled receptors family 1 profile domain-containing protein n=1 Tax=Chironomus riparius TaxID=315576 RepID=A0A9N9RVI9_9DIPT|nr:unnamed protein product [Chironomus riparius]